MQEATATDNASSAAFYFDDLAQLNSSSSTVLQQVEVLGKATHHTEPHRKCRPELQTWACSLCSYQVCHAAEQPTAASTCVAEPSATPCLSSVPGLFTSIAVGMQHVGKGRTEDEQAKNQVLMLLAVVRLPQVRMGTKAWE